MQRSLTALLIAAAHAATQTPWILLGTRAVTCHGSQLQPVVLSLCERPKLNSDQNKDLHDNLGCCRLQAARLLDGDKHLSRLGESGGERASATKTGALAPVC